jgi:DNA-binding beta-propeller fold protein YncE
MESARFDAFVRALDRALTRRRTLGAMLAALPAVPLAAAKTSGEGQRGKGKRRGGDSRADRDPRASAATCDATSCTATGGCCLGDTCVRDGGTWTPQLIFGGKGDAPNLFLRPVAIAVSADEQTAFVSDLFRIKIWVRSGDGWVFQTQLGSRGSGPGQFHQPEGLAVSADGRTLWVADSGNYRISVWRLSGGTWTPDTTFGSKGDGPDEFDIPAGVAVSPDGQTVWVADEKNDRISVWTKSGNTWVNQTTFGSGRGRGRNQFHEPEGVAVTPDGQTVVVGDTGNFRISVWTKSGNTWVNQTTFGGERSQFDNPRGVGISPDGQTIWVADIGNNRISIWQKSGDTWANRTTFGSKGKGLDDFDHPEGVAVSANGRTVWVADTSNDRIAVWASESPRIWSNQTTFGRKGDGRAEFDLPAGVAVSGDGQTAWVADLKNHRIAIWSRVNRTSWSLQTTFGRKGDGPGELELPAGVAVSADGQTVWVADLHNSRISVWTRSGTTWSNQTTFGSRGVRLQPVPQPARRGGERRRANRLGG